MAARVGRGEPDFHLNALLEGRVFVVSYDVPGPIQALPEEPTSEVDLQNQVMLEFPNPITCRV
jgi:hypothetical protein